jgi:hypothetical protein
VGPFVKTNSLTPFTESLMINFKEDIYGNYVGLCENIIKEKLDKNTNSRNLLTQVMRFREYGHSLMGLLKNGKDNLIKSKGG